MTKPNKIRYQMTQTTEYVEDSGAVTVYGICCLDESHLSDNESERYQTIPNISTKSDFVEELIEKLVRHDADPVHLRDLIEDYLP